LYYSWEKEQCDILLSYKGNGLAPLPEQNTRYPKLVSLGIIDRPFLVRKLAQLMNMKFPDNEYYLCELQRYVAFAIADASGWDRQEIQEEAEKKNMDVEHYVFWRETTK